jgi:hypothetical protein
MVHAGSGSWTNLTGGNWSLDTNWASNVIADGEGFTANFVFDATSAPTNIVLDSSRVIGHLSIGDSASIFRTINITPAGAETLTFNNHVPGRWSSTRPLLSRRARRD